MLCRWKGKCVRCCWLTSQSKLSINPAVRHFGRTAALLLRDGFMFSWTTWICHKCLLNTRVKASMVCWRGKDYPYMFNPASAASVAAFVHPLYTLLSVCFFLSTSPPLHLQFQPSVQLVGRGGQETGSSGGPGECQVQCTHLSDSAVHQEEEQHAAAATQRQEQSLWFP